ncbi:MAG: hypothetical protein AAB011_04130 [Candidatus Eisenbacteria bacterium]
MPETRENPRVPGWIWIAAASILVSVPIIVSIHVPGPSTAPRTAVPAPAAASSTAVPLPASAVAAPPDAGDHDLGVVTPRSGYDVAYDALESEMAQLRIEKGAIEAEDVRIRGRREELEQFERDHPDGAPPELFSRYEDDRAAYNSDVKAFRARAAAYSMKVAEMERRIEAIRPSAP